MDIVNFFDYVGIISLNQGRYLKRNKQYIFARKIQEILRNFYDYREYLMFSWISCIFIHFGYTYTVMPFQPLLGMQLDFWWKILHILSKNQIKLK